MSLFRNCYTLSFCLLLNAYIIEYIQSKKNKDKDTEIFNKILFYKERFFFDKVSSFLYAKEDKNKPFIEIIIKSKEYSILLKNLLAVFVNYIGDIRLCFNTLYNSIFSVRENINIYKMKKYLSKKRKENYKFKYGDLFKFFTSFEFLSNPFTFNYEKHKPENYFYKNKRGLFFKFDFLYAQAKLIKENKSYSFAKINNNNKFLAKSVFNAANENPVKNDIDLSKNICILGPTHSGKTDSLKTVIQLNQLTFLGAGVVPTKSLEIDPFRKINQNLIIPFSKYLSKNDSEVLALKNINNEKERSLNLLDEVLCGWPS